MLKKLFQTADKLKVVYPTLDLSDLFPSREPTVTLTTDQNDGNKSKRAASDAELGGEPQFKKPALPKR